MTSPRSRPAQALSRSCKLPVRSLQNGTAAPWNYYSGVPLFPRSSQEAAMNGIIYLIGLIVVILAILSFFGLR